MKEHAFGFARRSNGQLALAVVPLLCDAVGCRRGRASSGQGVEGHTLAAFGDGARPGLDERVHGTDVNTNPKRKRGFVNTNPMPSEDLSTPTRSASEDSSTAAQEKNQAVFSMAELLADFPVALLLSQ